MKVFLSLFMIFVLVLSLSLGVDESAKEIQNEAFNRAFMAFGLAKGLNMVISLIQGTQLSFTPVGVGLSFSIGEILDPFNDMVERFSWVMLASTVSLGVQKIILELSGGLFLQVALVLSVGLATVLLWYKQLKNSLYLSYSLKLFAILLLLRFSAVLFIYSSEILYNTTLEKKYTNASERVMLTKTQLDDLHQKNKLLVYEQKKEGFFSGLSSKYDRVLDNLNISKQLESMHSSIEKASQSIVTLITIFITQSVLLPLLYFWILISSIKFIFRTDFKFKKLNSVYNN
jgi:hypothetical protein